jgi:hypothetical protein
MFTPCSYLIALGKQANNYVLVDCIANLCAVQLEKFWAKILRALFAFVTNMDIINWVSIV